MARGSEEQVKQIIDTTLTVEQVHPFLEAANSLVTELYGSDTIYAEKHLQQIEIWLAAHFVALRDDRISKEKIGDANVEYEGKTGMGLNFTRYGQQVMVLDHQGKISAAMSGKRAATIEAIL